MPLLTFESPCRKLMSDALLLLLLVLEMKRSWLKVHHAYNMCVLGTKYNVHKERCALLDKWKNHIFYICFSFRQEVLSTKYVHWICWHLLAKSFNGVWRTRNLVSCFMTGQFDVYVAVYSVFYHLEKNSRQNLSFEWHYNLGGHNSNLVYQR